MHYDDCIVNSSPWDHKIDYYTVLLPEPAASQAACRWTGRERARTEWGKHSWSCKQPCLQCW
jgi:hypothetical protein